MYNVIERIILYEGYIPVLLYLLSRHKKIRVRSRMKKTQMCISISLLIICALAVPVLADKTGVTIEAPDTVDRGSSVTITIKVTHSGNNFIHHTNWLILKVNGEEVKRWDFSAFKKPESEKFTRTFTITVEDTTNISAEGNCNLHGSRGIATHIIRVK